ncbi:ribosome maturation factor RimM [Massilibacteroides vaginae]|uniref:ribosome maturation factor RimM n=1 Tax=Massilibacteroides vaginae TaxID=1673718 RepID=UPI000A1C871A|nr:ribosome maturation factor RimM [Massilibacteroides vaginae]
MIRKDDIVKIGYFAKPHGVKGEIALVTTFDLFDTQEDPFILCELDGIYVPFFVEEYRYKSDTVILVKIENLHSEEDIRPFTNKEVFCPKEWIDNSELDAGITWDNFIGYKVYDTNRGYLGEISDVDDSTLNVLFEVSDGEKSLLLPAVEEFMVELKHDEKSILMTVPDGLFEL